MHKEEHNILLPKDAHPFRHVFEPDDKHATPARKEDYWDIDPGNQLAIRHHHYPRKRLYMPNEDDARMFPGIGPRRYTVVAKSSEHIVDDCNQVRDRCLQEWWDGETYFDLGGREQIDFERAVAATRKGKPVRNKSEAKKEVKQSKFVTPSQDQQEKPGAMTKPVTRVTYDMRDFLESCVERYCELAKVERKSLKPAATPFHELRVALPTASEKETAGRLQPIASKVLMKILFAARMARWDLLRATQSLASRVTKWSPDCDLGLHRLVCYINSSLDTKMSGFIGDSIMDCRLWLFSDSDFAGEYDSTQKHPWLCKYVNEFISRSSPKGYTWTSFVLNFNCKARLHTDKYNQRESYNLTFSFGDYTGGALWIEGASQLGTPAKFLDQDGRQHNGYNCITYRKPTLLHPSTKHGVQPYKGDRHSVIAYSSGGYQKFDDSQKTLLKQAKFNLPTPQLKLKARSALVCIQQSVCSPLDEGGRFNPQTLRSRFRKDSFAHTSLVYTNTQQAAGLSQVFTTSRQCVC